MGITQGSTPTPLCSGTQCSVQPSHEPPGAPQRSSLLSCWGDLRAPEVAGSSGEGDAAGLRLPGASSNSGRFSANNHLKSGEGNLPTQAYPADPRCLASPMQKSLPWLVALGKGRPPDPGAEQGNHRTRCCPFHLQPDSVVQTNGAERLGQGEQLLAEVIHSAAELIGDTGSLRQERSR